MYERVQVVIPASPSPTANVFDVSSLLFRLNKTLSQNSKRSNSIHLSSSDL